MNNITKPILTLDDLHFLIFLIQDNFLDSDIVIAGGAPRDILNGRPVKDIDVFLTMADSYGDSINSLAKVLNVDAELMNSEELYAHNTASLSVNLKAAYKGYDIQLIFIESCQTPAKYIEANFDLGICQVWVACGEIHMTKAYKKDIDNKTITYLNPSEIWPRQKIYRINHLYRVKNKYPTFTIRNLSSLSLKECIKNAIHTSKWKTRLQAAGRACGFKTRGQST